MLSGEIRTEVFRFVLFLLFIRIPVFRQCPLVFQLLVLTRLVKQPFVVNQAWLNNELLIIFGVIRYNLLSLMDN